MNHLTAMAIHMSKGRNPLGEREESMRRRILLLKALASVGDGRAEMGVQTWKCLQTRQPLAQALLIQSQKPCEK